MSLFDDYEEDVDIAYMMVEQEAEQGIWTTKDGRQMAVSEMTDEHIANAIKLLKRNDVNDMCLPWIERFEVELQHREGAEK